MSRDMGGGRKAYIMRLGKQVNRDDLIEIFEYAELPLVGTVQDQRDYFRAWVDSLKG